MKSGKEAAFLQKISKETPGRGYDAGNPLLLKVVQNFVEMSVRFKQGLENSGGDGFLTMTQIAELALESIKTCRELVLASIMKIKDK